jgi:hypothetical protein
MRISKEKFSYFVNKYKAAMEEMDHFHEALRPYFDSPVCRYQSELLAAYEELLVEISECADEDAIFSWWVNEPQQDQSNSVITVQNTKSGEIAEYNVHTTEGLYNYLFDMYHNTDDVIHAETEMPEARVEEIVYGIWKYYSTTMMECSVCQKHVPRHRYKRCPNCGAHMKGFDYECNL